MALPKPKSLYAASKQQYTVGGEVQVRTWDGIHEWQKTEPGD